jgi:hypothetical protein
MSIAAANHETLQPGRSIHVNGKKYRITGRIIQPMGRYSEVYPALTSSGKPCAIKMMIPEGSLLGPHYNHSKPEREKAFKDEIDFLSLLKNCHIVVRMFDHGMVEELNLPAIVEELLDLNLRVSEYNKIFSEDQAYSFSVQLLSMLAVAHSKKIAYRDFQRFHFFFNWDEHTHTSTLKVVDWNLSSRNKDKDLLISNEMESIKTNKIHLFYSQNSQISKIVFKGKQNSAEEILLDLLKHGAQGNYKCPTSIPLKYRLWAIWFRYGRK